MRRPAVHRTVIGPEGRIPGTRKNRRRRAAAADRRARFVLDRVEVPWRSTSHTRVAPCPTHTRQSTGFGDADRPVRQAGDRLHRRNVDPPRVRVRIFQNLPESGNCLSGQGGRRLGPSSQLATSLRAFSPGTAAARFCETGCGVAALWKRAGQDHAAPPRRALRVRRHSVPDSGRSPSARTANR